MVDGSEIAERAVRRTLQTLRGQNVPVVLLQVLRRFTEQKEKQRAFYLQSELRPQKRRGSSKSFPGKRLPRRSDSKRSALHRTKRFAPRSTSVWSRSAIRLLGARGVRDGAHREPIAPAEAKSWRFSPYHTITLRGPCRHRPSLQCLACQKTRWSNLRRFFPIETSELLIEVEPGLWRTVHNLVALESLEQILWPGDGKDRRLWRQNLSAWAIEFADFCRGDDPLPRARSCWKSQEDVFIYRDNSDLLGTEKAGSPSFARLMEDIPVLEGALEVQRKLVEIFPEEAHFWAHSGRFTACECVTQGAPQKCLHQSCNIPAGRWPPSSIT